LRAVGQSVVAVALVALVGCSNYGGYRLAGLKRQPANAAADLGDEGKIIFDLRKAGQRIEATCSASSPECSNLTLKAGSPVDCYVHPRGGAVPYSYGVRMDAHANDAAGLVCHSGDGQGKLLVLHAQTCVDAKLVPLPPLSDFPEHSLPMMQEKIDGKDEEFISEEFGDSFKKEHPPGNTAHESYERGGSYSPFFGFRAYVPTSFNEDQVKKYFVWLRQQELVIVDSAGTVTTPWPAPYEGYIPALDNSQRFCKDEKDRYFNERGTEVQDDSVSLAVAESAREKQ
jgi:hypothetical protein